MTRTEYQDALGKLPFGKRLPTAVYVHREEAVAALGLNHPVTVLISSVTQRLQVGPEYNVVKFRLGEFKLSFLSYPAFFEDPHPALERALTVDLVKGKSRVTEYQDQFNPPILHRKETLLPGSHPKWDRFAKLTRQEEEAGLLDETSTIGFRLNWERRLRELGCRLLDHRLERTVPVGHSAEAGDTKPIVERHRTALSRYELSKPVRTVLEHGLLKIGNSVFDYGCGRGTDMIGLRGLGYEVSGWDPAFLPEARRSQADVVNFGYVLNVIEDPAERVEALMSAFRLSGRLLVVSALTRETVDMESAARLADGVLTRNNTFQKYYDQAELQQFIEDTLEATAIPAALGIYYVFRNPVEAEEFLNTRTRRFIDWTQLHSRLGLPKRKKSAEERLVEQYEKHKAVLEPLWLLLLRLGRPPLPEEFPGWQAVREAVGSPNAAIKLLRARNGDAALTASREARKSDLLVYLALAQLRKRAPFSHLSPGLRADIRHFFGDYQRAQLAGRELLFAAGDADEIGLVCEDLALGWQDEQAVYVHRSLLPELPPILRVYAGCATALYGLVEEADVLKLHKASGKVTFLRYDDFEGERMPMLELRIKVNLRSRWVEVFDHRADEQLLYFKDRLVAPESAMASELADFARRLQKLGVASTPFIGPNRRDLSRLLVERNLTQSLYPRKPR
jgi:DNA phosphorothioation-associated putative methyltransferase